MRRLTVPIMKTLILVRVLLNFSNVIKDLYQYMIVHRTQTGRATYLTLITSLTKNTSTTRRLKYYLRARRITLRRFLRLRVSLTRYLLTRILLRRLTMVWSAIFTVRNREGRMIQDGHMLILFVCGMMRTVTRIIIQSIQMILIGPLDTMLTTLITTMTSTILGIILILRLRYRQWVLLDEQQCLVHKVVEQSWRQLLTLLRATLYQLMLMVHSRRIMYSNLMLSQVYIILSVSVLQILSVVLLLKMVRRLLTSNFSYCQFPIVFLWYIL